MPPTSPSTAHRLSRPFIIDPAYSATEPTPPKKTYALAIEQPAQVNWLYAAGDLEAFLLARMKLEGFRDSREVAHPGLFRAPATLIYFARTFVVNASQIKKGRRLGFRHNGLLRVSVNGVAQCSHVAKPGEAAEIEVELKGRLKVGENTLKLVLSSLGEPCTFSLAKSGLESNPEWKASHDDQRWTLPTCVPVVAGSAMPHWEALPTVPIQPVKLADDLYSISPEFVASVELIARRTMDLTVVAGESPLEARSKKLAEQYAFRTHAKAGQIVRTPRAAMSHFTVSGADEIASMVCHGDSYPVAYRGAFACGDPLLNRIWMNSAYTLRACLRELLVDGLKRDRMPWVGDLFVSILSNAATFGVAGPIRRTLIALAGLNARENHANGIIDYTLYWLMSIERHDWYFNDPAFIHASRPLIVEMLAGLAACENAEGWLMCREHDWLFLDWATMEKNGVVSALQFLYVLALRSVERLAARAGWRELHSQVKRKRVRLETCCRRDFWNAKQGGFVEAVIAGRRSPSIGRHANFFAVLSGATSVTQDRSILKRVIDNSAVPKVGTPYMRFFENMARARLGALPGMVADVKSYWGGMLEAGATTFWEAYDPDESAQQHLAFYGRPFGRSLCHVWASGPAYLLSEELSGLRMLEPCWKSFTLKRNPSLEMPLHLSMPTPRGEIILDRTPKGTRLRIPAGSTFIEKQQGKTLRFEGPKNVSLD